MNAEFAGHEPREKSIARLRKPPVFQLVQSRALGKRIYSFIQRGRYAVWNTVCGSILQAPSLNMAPSYSV